MFKPFMNKGPLAKSEGFFWGEMIWDRYMKTSCASIFRFSEGNQFLATLRIYDGTGRRQ